MESGHKAHIPSRPITGRGPSNPGMQRPALGRAHQTSPDDPLAQPPQTLAELRLSGALPNLPLLLFAPCDLVRGFFRIPVVLALSSLHSPRDLGHPAGDYWIPGIGAILPGDAVFLVGFLFALAVRFTNRPSTTSAESMNHAFIASIIREPVVPPSSPGLREEGISPSTTTSATG